MRRQLLGNQTLGDAIVFVQRLLAFKLTIADVVVAIDADDDAWNEEEENNQKDCLLAGHLRMFEILKKTSIKTS